MPSFGPMTTYLKLTRSRSNKTKLGCDCKEIDLLHLTSPHGMIVGREGGMAITCPKCGWLHRRILEVYGAFWWCVMCKKLNNEKDNL